MNAVERYGRIQIPAPAGASCLWVQTPAGARERIPTFLNQEYDFVYDRHGYEAQTPRGEAYRCARYTPEQEGEYLVYDEAGAQVEAFVCTPSDNPGYVQVSRRDPRYFAFSDGSSYVPIGLNLVGCGYDRQPAGNEHFRASEDVRTTGMIQWRRWLAQMREGGANYARIWLSNRYTQARTEIMGVHDSAALARLDKVLDLARQYGIRVKLCFEHFRTFTDAGHFAYKRVVDPDTGRQLLDVETWFREERWNRRWLEDIAPYLDRYQNDPVVFAWELWNEIDCGDACFETVERFTRRMLPEVKRRSPKNLVVNSLGSMDEACKQQVQDAFAAIPDMDFLQVHRYLDQGAPLEICREDPVAFSQDAVQRCSTGKKPLILTETGAVNDRHVGPFRFYSADHGGRIFDDVTYPAFFCGAAGSGHIWHWDCYVDAQNLWPHFRPLHDALEGVQVDAENFQPDSIPDERAWILELKGDDTTLVLVRSRADRWDFVLRDGKEPPVLAGIDLPLRGKAEVFWLPGDEGACEPSAQGWTLSGFRRGCIVKIQNEK